MSAQTSPQTESTDNGLTLTQRLAAKTSGIAIGLLFTVGTVAAQETTSTVCDASFMEPLNMILMIVFQVGPLFTAAAAGFSMIYAGSVQNFDKKKKYKEAGYSAAKTTGILLGAGFLLDVLVMIMGESNIIACVEVFPF